jgi:HEAT repeat protein
MITGPIDGEDSLLDAPTFAEALDVLTDPDAVLRPGLLAALSDPRPSDVTQFTERWADLAAEARLWIAQSLMDAAEASFQLRFEPLFRTMLADDEPAIRVVAVEGLWEDERVDLVDAFVGLLRNDVQPEVRGCAATALGPFVYRAELGEVPMGIGSAAALALVEAAADEGEDEDVRRRAVESAGFADLPEVHNLITDLYALPERALRAGAVAAMGNSADEGWEMEVLEALEDVDPLVQFAAATAAGQLGLEDAVPLLVELIDGGDRELQIAAVWSLGEVGGRQAVKYLEALLGEDPDPDLEEAIEDALASAALSGGDFPDWGIGP